jgi:apolipoprotein D and lipocalin family protein
VKRFLALMVLAGCTAATPPAPSKPVPFRNPTVLVASQSDVTLARLNGDWRVVSIFEDAQFGAVRRVSFTPDAMRVNGTAFPIASLKEGRLIAGGQPFWVHWLDINNRTAVIGSPDGKYGWIMDRTGTPSADRLKAAREILDWYGYDLSRMKDV